MASITIPYAVADFIEIRERGFYYVDKTQYIAKLEDYKAPVFLRPRRFGKSLLVSTLACYYDRTKAHRFEELFGDTWIGNHPTKEHNRYMIIRYDFSAMVMSDHIQGLAQNFNDLNCGPVEVMVAHNRDLFGDFEFSNRGDASKMLEEVLTYARSHELPKVYILIDEYDVPIAKASSNGYYKEMLEVMKAMLSTALKDNEALKFAVVTGCLKIAKESVFTGTNNFVSDTISSERYNEYYGFTQKDVDQILQDAQIEEKASDIKEWYDGYRFGEFDVYCPWDVMNYLWDLTNNQNAKPVSYWKNTSDNAIIRSFIDYSGAAIKKKLEILISGGSIRQQIEENLTYDYLHSSEENLWSILYLTGYLTNASEQDTDGTIELKIPNKEIKEIFETTVKKWFEDNAKTIDRKELFDAVWTGNADILTKEIGTLLRMTISYHDYKEDFYHAFLAGIFAGAGYVVESNKEHGEGRSDIVIYDDYEGKVAIFEAKKSQNPEDMILDCEKAIKQINEKMYANEFEDAYDEILCYGISFFKKRCLVKKK